MFDKEYLLGDRFTIIEKSQKKIEVYEDGKILCNGTLSPAKPFLVPHLSLRYYQLDFENGGILQVFLNKTAALTKFGPLLTCEDQCIGVLEKKN